MALIDDKDDKKSFEELYEKYNRLAYSIAFNILKNNELAEDACSEAFLSIAKCFEKIKDLEPHKLEKYIVITVRNTSINMYNKERRRVETVPLSDNFLDLTDESLSDKNYDNIIGCIKQLSDTDQEILYLRINFGLKYNEIADTLHISNAAARKRLQNAKDNLLKKLNKEEIYLSYFWDDVNYMSDNCYDSNQIIDIATYSETDYINYSADFEISNTAIMAVNNIDVSSNSFNGNNMVLYSCFGNIDLTSSNVLGSGLIYAPFGIVTIKCDRINFNGIIIAQNIKIVGGTDITLNKNEEFINSLGSGKSTITEPDENDNDIIDIGEAYFKEITSPDDIIDAGNGLYCVKHQLLLTADDNVGFEQIRELAESYNASIVGYIELTNDYQIEFNYDIDIDELKGMISIISDIPYIQNVSLNLISYESPEFYSNDSEWSDEWVESVPSGNNWNIEEIQLESALIEMGVIENESSSYDSATTDALHSVKIGLIDNAFDETHEDLYFTKVWNNSYAPKGDHGTHVAGTMAAKFNNGKGITGVSIKNRLYAFSYDGETKEDTTEELKNATQLFKKSMGLHY
ncbi:MAG: sigma-70 family RNA polymerase sigma factor [Oscillospiraceae bacterium]|nr:sigma-70 family RNA polymerase sigma factor [Oscillospiraceae bacterium]